MKNGHAAYGNFETGARHGTDYKLYFESNGQTVSPFHDIPLHVSKDDRVFNMVVEVQRWSNAKFEINKEEKFNPIKQDVKKGKPRFVHNIFPYTGYIWNYGALPQTWEDPCHVDENTGAKGDNDPVDVCEIGSKVHKTGSVVQVKILGTFALIDEGETDWKMLAIDVTDPLAEKLNDLEDIETHLPGLLKATHDWFRLYKIPDGKPENKFAFEGKPKSRDFALNIIDKCHECWKSLIQGNAKCDDISTANATVADSNAKVSAEDCTDLRSQLNPVCDPLPIPAEVGKWHFVKA